VLWSMKDAATDKSVCATSVQTILKLAGSLRTRLIIASLL